MSCIRLCFYLSIILWVSHPLSARELRKLTVSQSATISKPSDEASWTMGVRTQNAKLAAAQSENDAKMHQVLSALQDEGIDPKEMQTSGYSISPVYSSPPKSPPPDWAPRITHYEVQNSIRVRTTKLEIVGPAIASAAEKGANVVDQISFSLSDKVEAQQEAIQEAVLAAHVFAQAAAEAAKVSLDDVLEISISSSSISPRYFQGERFALAASAQGAPIVSGEVDVQASVTLVYILVD